jgi:hypothetical protein
MTDTDDPASRDAPAADRPASKRDDHDDRNDAEDIETTDEEDSSPRSERTDQKHLQGIEDGCGCAEVWEHLSAQRERNRRDRAEGTSPPGTEAETETRTGATED